MFCSAMDSIPLHEKANVICTVTCPDSNEDYVGKIDCNLVTRFDEHASHEGQPMHQHLSKCEHFAHIIDLHSLPDIDASQTEIGNTQHFINAVIPYFCVVHTCCNWSQLLFLQALYIKNLPHKINDGLKATGELGLSRKSND